MFHGLYALPDADTFRADHFAHRFALPRLDGQPADGYWLQLDAVRLALVTAHGHGAVYADFVDGAARHRREHGGGSGQPVARAVGIRGVHRPSVADATAGLGRDAFVLATLGCEVTLIERSPVAAALLDDALRRAAADTATADIAARMRLVHADAADWLSALTPDERPDVVYLDPMFPDTGKSAAAKKDMQAFQTVIGDDLDAGKLVAAARAAAKKRVVVKRPRLGALLGSDRPSTQMVGKSTRFDLYTPSY